MIKDTAQPWCFKPVCNFVPTTSEITGQLTTLAPMPGVSTVAPTPNPHPNPYPQSGTNPTHALLPKGKPGQIFIISDEHYWFTLLNITLNTANFIMFEQIFLCELRYGFDTVGDYCICRSASRSLLYDQKLRNHLMNIKENSVGSHHMAQRLIWIYNLCSCNKNRMPWSRVN
jgi:hypothetical protein